MVRPSFYRSDRTGPLAPDVRDLLIGLTTLADDDGWALWRPASIAVTLYPYEPHGRRLRALERRAAVLVEAGLLDIRSCGCAHLPTLREHASIKSGEKTHAIWNWHQRHASEGLRSGPEHSVSASGSESSSSSVLDKASASSRAGEAAPNGSGAACPACGKVGEHDVLCQNATHLRVVSA